MTLSSGILMAYFVILSGFLALSGLGFGLRNRSPFWTRVLLVLGCVGCCSLVAWQVYATFLQVPRNLPDRPLAAAGYFLGHEVAHELTGRRGDIVLIDAPGRGSDRAVADALSTTFARVLQPMSGLQLLQANLPKVTRSSQSSAVGLAVFEQVFAAQPNALAYVSFTGAPAGIENSSFLVRSRTPFFVFDSAGSTNWVAGLKKGIICAVITPRPRIKPSKGERIAGSPEEIFQRFYLLAKPATTE